MNHINTTVDLLQIFIVHTVSTGGQRKWQDMLQCNGPAVFSQLTYLRTVIHVSWLPVVSSSLSQSGPGTPRSTVASCGQMMIMCRDALLFSWIKERENTCRVVGRWVTCVGWIRISFSWQVCVHIQGVWLRFEVVANVRIKLDKGRQR